MNLKLLGPLGVLSLVFAAAAVDFGGIGVVLIGRGNPELLRIGTVYPGSPAERAGIKPQSFLISINGTNAVSLSSTQCASMVRGPAGTSVTLEVADASLSHTNKFTVKRGKVVISKDKVEVVDE
jgi:carboxyl-terminal processing protease